MPPSSKISHSSRRVHSSKLAGGDAQCQCSSFFTVSQPARAAQPAVIGPTRPQPAGTRFRTRSFQLTAKGLYACSKACLRCQWKFLRARSRGRRLRPHVSSMCGLIPVCLCIFYMCTCGATALRLSYMPDCLSLSMHDCAVLYTTSSSCDLSRKSTTFFASPHRS